MNDSLGFYSPNGLAFLMPLSGINWPLSNMGLLLDSSHRGYPCSPPLPKPFPVNPIHPPPQCPWRLRGARRGAEQGERTAEQSAVLRPAARRARLGGSGGEKTKGTKLQQASFLARLLIRHLSCISFFRTINTKGNWEECALLQP